MVATRTEDKIMEAFGNWLEENYPEVVNGDDILVEKMEQLWRFDDFLREIAEDFGFKIGDKNE